MDIIGTVFGGHGQHWHNDHHWHSVLVAMVNIGTVDIIGTVFWWPWSTLAQWSSLAECVMVAVINIDTVVIIGAVFW